MKIVLIAGAFILLLVVVILIVAAGLPVEHTVSRSVRLRKSPSKVFALISGPPDWQFREQTGIEKE